MHTDWKVDGSTAARRKVAIRVLVHLGSNEAKERIEDERGREVLCC